MNFILSSILPALAPALTDGIRGIFAKFTGGTGGVPQNVDERIRLMDAENERLKALGQLDMPIGNPSQWVVDLRASFRYIFIPIVWLITLIVVSDNTVSVVIKSALVDLSGACLSFVIGERMYLKLKTGIEK